MCGASLYGSTNIPPFSFSLILSLYSGSLDKTSFWANVASNDCRGDNLLIVCWSEDGVKPRKGIGEVAYGG